MVKRKALQEGLLNYLNLNREFRGEPVGGKVYSGIEDLVLKNGVFMRRDVKGEKRVKRGKPKNCFGNSGHLVALHPERYVYVEGYALPDGMPIAFHHAWVFDTHTGMAIDPTWDIEDAVCYLGIPFNYDFLTQCYQEYGYYCLLDYPAIKKWVDSGFPDNSIATISPESYL